MDHDAKIAAAERELARQKRRALLIVALMVIIAIAGVALQLIAPGLSYRRGLHPNYDSPAVSAALIGGKALWGAAMLGFWPLARIGPRIGHAQQMLDGARMRAQHERKGKLLH